MWTPAFAKPPSYKTTARHGLRRGRRIDTNAEEMCPGITRMDTKIHLKRKSFALIRVIRGQICLSLLFQGGTRCRQRVRRKIIVFATFAKATARRGRSRSSFG